MDDDIQLMHYVVRKGLAEHQQLVSYNQALRALLMHSIMSNPDETVAESLMEKFTEVNKKYKDSACLDSSE